MAKRSYRNFRDVEEDYFRDHPEEVESYIDEIFADYAKDGDSASLLASLRVIAQAQGVSKIARKAGISRQGVQHALSSKGNPRLDNINAIMHAMGYRLTPEKIHTSRK